MVPYHDDGGLSRLYRETRFQSSKDDNAPNVRLNNEAHCAVSGGCDGSGGRKFLINCDHG